MAIKDQASRGVTRQVLADHVYEVLLIALMDGRLEAGTPVSIDGMALALDVSPTPVREALARLEATGMVRRTALRGYRVAPLLAPAERADLMNARLVIEPANTFMAASTPTATSPANRRRPLMASKPRREDGLFPSSEPTGKPTNGPTGTRTTSSCYRRTTRWAVRCSDSASSPSRSTPRSFAPLKPNWHGRPERLFGLQVHSPEALTIFLRR